ncbi:pyridoxamine 5'-phosphate oxidase family protein [Cohaesibacter gelatinilyticus]|uniref:Pyridoxamine 5'-phosphate oxidase N-terminal domain-containing protein n=1 Tax=Cohaesibacter gelatinilyticus TaxID=372072 RepID=A0A285PIB9_9HYPH|nr:hypothetical protein SAMN06265368_4590 [Cohaesibacter gelatinilyticus]
MDYSSDIAFTDRVKSIQSRKGSRFLYSRMEENGSWATEITPMLANYIAQQRSVFFATANEEGQPYIQHRGGQPGFIKVLDNKTLGFVDYKGNQQFISQGNLADNAKAFLFLIDYQNQSRIKIWGEAKVIEEDADLMDKLLKGTETNLIRPEQVITFRILAWDRNCPQHIPQRFEGDDVRAALHEKEERIQELETQLEALQDKNSLAGYRGT